MLPRPTSQVANRAAQWEDGPTNGQLIGRSRVPWAGRGKAESLTCSPRYPIERPRTPGNGIDISSRKSLRQLVPPKNLMPIATNWAEFRPESVRLGMKIR